MSFRGLKDFCHEHGVHEDAPSCPACGIQEKLDEALMQIELLENTINDLNLRIAFLES